MTAAALMVFAWMLLVAAGSPGPSIAALVARVLTNGLRDILPFLAAMWVGEAIWLSFAVGGLAVLAQKFAVIGDTGIHQRCGEEFWQRLVEAMREHFKAENFTDAVVHAIPERSPS